MATGIGSSIASAFSSRKAADEQRKKQAMIEQQAAEDKALFNKQYYQDMSKRSDVQNMLRILDQNQKKADTAAAARAAITGATPEQQLASQEVNRRTYADALADIASNSAQMRDQYLRDYQGQRSRTWQQRLGMQDQLAAIHQNTSNQWANAAINGFQGGAQMLASGLGQMGTNTPAVETPAPATEGTLKAAGPVQIGDNGMQMNPDGTLSNPKLNPYDRQMQEFSDTYKLTKPQQNPLSLLPK